MDYSNDTTPAGSLVDLEPGAQDRPGDLREVLAGLSQPQKTLPAKLFYDAEGCRLFGEITRLPEYYLTRTEHGLLRDIGPELPRQPGCTLVEYGASDETKALLILDAIGADAYVPVDVAAEALAELQARLAQTRRELRVYPVAADFLCPVELPRVLPARPRFGFFPGSTIGNCTPRDAGGFLAQARATLGQHAMMLVGVDLQKPLETLLPAYDDAHGITAAFNRNILAHLNRVFAAEFDLAAFDHVALWNQAEGRIEMHLRSRREQRLRVAGVDVAFAAGETIHTENSYKHTVAGFQHLAQSAGWQPSRAWTDAAGLFSIHLLTT